MQNTGAEFDGLKFAEAREKVIQKLTELGLLQKEQEITHNVAKCYRCGSTVEPMLSKQWFMKMKALAEKTIAAINSGEIQYFPEKWKKIAIDWLANIKDWCISRQIWWGHQIPIEGSTDTFDTWFSSALWPFATLGWPKQTRELQEFYPTSVITSARDILHLWISRMIFSGLEFTGQAPFHDVIIHATVLAKDGKRMSKSLGTGLNPLDFIEKYGADATRFGLIYQALGGQDIHFNEDVLIMGKKFCNKLWNISRYVLLKSGDDVFLALPETLGDNENGAIIEKLNFVSEEVTKKLQSYEFGQAAHDLYDFVWHDFADKYIEASKDSESDETKAVLLHCIKTILQLLHPFMPFISEELWKNYGQKNLLLVSEWPLLKK
jgi:valyl-tRNA synthetase